MLTQLFLCRSTWNRFHCTFEPRELIFVVENRFCYFIIDFMTH